MEAALSLQPRRRINQLSGNVANPIYSLDHTPTSSKAERSVQTAARDYPNAFAKRQPSNFLVFHLRRFRFLVFEASEVVTLYSMLIASRSSLPLSTMARSTIAPFDLATRPNSWQ